MFTNVVDDQVFPQDADAREITIPLPLIETTSDHEFVGDLDPAFPRCIDLGGDFADLFPVVWTVNDSECVFMVNEGDQEICPLAPKT